jgi:hypothetical protein
MRKQSWASPHRISVLGSIGLACVVVMWLEMLVPKFVTTHFSVLERIGPYYWFLPLAMILLPTVAAIRGSRWWLAVTALSIATFVVFLRIVLD